MIYRTATFYLFFFLVHLVLRLFKIYCENRNIRIKGQVLKVKILNWFSVFTIFSFKIKANWLVLLQVPKEYCRPACPNYFGPIRRQGFLTKIWTNTNEDLISQNLIALLIHLYLIFEKSSLKNQVSIIGFLTCKNRFQNWFCRLHRQ